MSRTNRVEAPTNPVQKYISFRGKEGCFAYWDKDTETNYKMGEVEIALIDIKHSLSGYHEMSQGIVSSNLIGDITKETLEVRLWNKGNSNVIAKGNYKQIKDEVRAYGGKYTQNLICLVAINDELEVCNIQLNGASLGNWIDFRNRISQDKIYDNWITLSQGSLCKREKGQNVTLTPEQTTKILNQIQASPLGSHPILFYNVKVSLGNALNSIAIAKADDADRQLQAYCEHYKNNQNQADDSNLLEDSNEDDFRSNSFNSKLGGQPVSPLTAEGRNRLTSSEECITPPPLNFTSPSRIPDNESLEYSKLIKTDGLVTGWTIEGLAAFIGEKYQVDLENLATLGKQTLASIYQEIQLEELIEKYCEVPF